MKSKIIVLLVTLLSVGKMNAQYNIDRLITSGEVALHYEDYVLSIQYFNKVLSLKPYLWLPWYNRAVAKFYLDDFVGAEQDASEAIGLNPYIEQIFDLRAISRIRQEKFGEAIDDYTKAIRLNPSVSSFWLNRAICRLKTKDYDQALLDADTIIKKWSDVSSAYSLKAEICLNKKDTVEADTWLAKSLQIDPYNVDAWTTRSYIALNRQQWKTADSCLSRVVHLNPKSVNSYVNRALARLNYNNLRGAMEDYDLAIDLDPNNFLAHFNRGLLRVQLGDDNRAIEDFDFVIKMEPQNFMAIYNRALLHDKTGNLRAAIADYSQVINQFPNFWAGLSNRARCYRRLGMTAKAELDEFRIFKAQMDKRIGGQRRWSKEKLKEMRRRSEINIDKYNNIVVEDKSEVEHEYKSQYRGTIQNRDVEFSLLPMYQLSYFSYSNGIQGYQAYDPSVDRFNSKHDPIRKLTLACKHQHSKLSDVQSRQIFQIIDVLSAGIGEESNPKVRADLLLQRAIAFADAQNYSDAISDLDDYLSLDKTSVIGWWTRATCQTLLNNYDSSRGQNVSMKAAQAEGDFAEAIKLAPKNAYLYFNRANMFADQKNFDRAVSDYTYTIQLDPRLAEAYYNRGIVFYRMGKYDAAQQDLSKAGELGLYDAYALSKKIKEKKD
ncbi:tetratricopeptide repeat protein [Hallella bergensis DSM 17361]|uniref:Tetratricopeptide repeat protein n=1 Tax=Hallella bergensis DSM 17361 TaxID=585502 RepID=D1PY13_9BACT|nr:tetratricopeptide repeat protein [Hallella bergensis]EFA43686.1 tetratricopeptide repeat protein [Hallella bergensis DSM 17361]